MSEDRFGDLGTGERRAAAERRAALAPLRRRIEDIERRLGKAAEILSLIDERLSEPGLYGDPAKVAELARKRAEAERAREMLESQWLEESGKLEDAEQAAS